MCGEAVDNKGKSDSSCPETLHVVDNTDPSTSIISPSAGTWFNSDFTVSFSDSDGESGLDRCEYRIVDGGSVSKSWNTRSCDGSITVDISQYCTIEGTDECTVQSRAYDLAGNSDTDSRSFSIDTTDPNTILSTTPPDCFNNSFTVQFSDSDSESGLDYCEYKVVDDGTIKVSWSSRSCNGVETIDVPGDCTEGDSTCSVRSKAVDNVGNVGTASSDYSVDLTDPQINCDGCSYQQHSLIYYNPTIIESSYCGLDLLEVCTSSSCSNLYCSDSSGDSKCNFNATERFGRCSFDPAKSYYIKAVDQAGNSAMTGEKSFPVKKTIGCNCSFGKQCLTGNCIGETCFYIAGPNIYVG